MLTEKIADEATTVQETGERNHHRPPPKAKLPPLSKRPELSTIWKETAHGMAGGTSPHTVNERQTTVMAIFGDLAAT